MSWLTTHVLDLVLGRPAAGVTVICEIAENGTFAEVARGTTDTAGRVPALFGAELPLQPGVYRLSFQTGEYFSASGVQTFYPAVQILFEARAGETHYHVPLLVGPFGYTTYRGS